MTERQSEVLGALSSTWVTPMMIGGRDQSHHARTLAQLVKAGLAETKKLHAIYCWNGSRSRQKLVGNRWVITHGHPPHPGCCCKGHRRYRITRKGRVALRRLHG